MKAISRWKVGWTKDKKFVFQTPSIRLVFSGPRADVVKTLWEQLPRLESISMTQEAPSSFIEDLKKEQHAIRSQDNTDASERSEDPLKFIVGTVLTFRSYSPDEVATLGKDHKYTFQRGDRLVVDEKNGCGMGIDVTRIRDGKRDMVWPEEVVVARNQTMEA